MKQSLIIEAASAEELKKSVADLYHAMHAKDTTARDTRMTDEQQPPLVKADVDAALAAAQEEKPAKAAKKKTAVAGATVASTPAPSVAPAAPAEPAAAPSESADDIFGAEPKAPVAVPYTMDDCQKRLQAVVKAKDITVAKALLSQFGISKLVELKPDQFTKFISAADDLT